MNYQGLTYINDDDDPIELPESLTAVIGKDSKEYIDLAFEKILQEAKENGVSKEG